MFVSLLYITELLWRTPDRPGAMVLLCRVRIHQTGRKEPTISVVSAGSSVFDQDLLSPLDAFSRSTVQHTGSEDNPLIFLKARTEYAHTAVRSILLLCQEWGTVRKSNLQD